jgi:RecA DNA recombination protein
MNAAVRSDPLTLRGLPALAPFLVRPAGAPARRPVLATGVTSLDDLLGGGFPRGRIAEVVGPRGAGRTSLGLATLGRATAAGGLVALVDAADGLDPASAVGLGVDLGQLLWIRCGGVVRTAVQAADVVVRGGGFDAVLVDWGDSPPGALLRVPSSAIVRLQRAVEGTPTTLLFAGLRRVAGSLAAVALALGPARARWQPGGPGRLAELVTEARLIRSRERAPGASVRLTWGA